MPKQVGQRFIDSRWIFKIIQDTDGQIIRHKARLCARGFLQRYGMDYCDTFAPVVRYDSIRVLLALAMQQDFEMLQFDVRTAFLYGELEETIHMAVPEGLETPNSGEKICKLNKSLYGLKQSPRCWNIKFSNFLKSFNFKESHAEKCIYRAIVNGKIVYLALFVDDGLIVSESKAAIQVVINRLKGSFDITVMDVNSFIGMQIERDRTNK